MINMKEFKLNGSEYIELCHLLKLETDVQSGGHAKQEIADGLVRVNGQVELRKKCKIKAGQRVNYEDIEIRVVE